MIEKKGYSFLIVVLFAVICFLTVYVIVDRKLGNNCPVCRDVSVSEEKEYKNPIVDLYYVEDTPFLNINGNKVVLDENTRSISDITTFRDMVLFVQSDPDFWILSFADSNGKIFKKISFDDVLGNGLSSYEINGNDIYIVSNLLSQDDIAVVCNQKKNGKNEDVVFNERIEYLGDGKFSNFVLLDTIKTNQYIKNNNITCE